MYADGFLNQRQRHPYAMGAAVAINLSVLAAVMLARGDVIIHIPNRPTTFTTYPVDPPPPPPHPIEQPKLRTHNQPLPQPSPQPQPTPKIDTTTSIDMGSHVTGQGSGTVDLPLPPKPMPTPTATPEPVLTSPVQLGGDAQPPYPPSLERQGIQGNVVVRVLMGTDGRVKQVEIVSSDDPAFSDATERQALRKWRFRPATRDGVPVESWKRLTVRFQLRG